MCIKGRKKIHYDFESPAPYKLQEHCQNYKQYLAFVRSIRIGNIPTDSSSLPTSHALQAPLSHIPDQR